MTGDTVICRWKDDKRAAYSISGDDSLHSQLDFMIPEMLKRGFTGTLWINPGRGATGEQGFCWRSRRDEWQEAARCGFDFANHTLHHVDTLDVRQAEYEISESARMIWAANPRQRLQLFLRGGGTVWQVTDEDTDAILRRYDCVHGRGGGVEDPAFHGETNTSATGAEFIASVDRALSEGSWRLAACHGVGPAAEWLPTDTAPFLTLLDYLYEKRESIWVDTNTNIHKYETERTHTRVSVSPEADGLFRVTLATDMNSVSSDGLPLNLYTSQSGDVLYDYPLTLKTEVPKSWTACYVTQGYETASVPVINHFITYTALPGQGTVELREARHS